MKYYAKNESSGGGAIFNHELPSVKNWCAEVKTQITTEAQMPNGVNDIILEYAMTSVHDTLRFFKMPDIITKELEKKVENDAAPNTVIAAMEEDNMESDRPEFQCLLVWVNKLLGLAVKPNIGACIPIQLSVQLLSIMG